MSFLGDAWRSLTGKGTANALAKAAGGSSVPGQIFGAPTSQEEAYGIIQGMFPWGTPPTRGTRELLMLYAASPWMRSVVSRLAHRVAATRWRVYQITDPNTGRAVRSKALQEARSPEHRKHILKELRFRKGPFGSPKTNVQELDEHPMLDWLAAGNSMLSGYDSLFIWQIHWELKGDAYMLLERWEEGELKGLPQAFWPIPPYWVQLTPTTLYPAFRLQWQGWNPVIPETEIIWDRDPDPFFPYGRGKGIAESLADELQTDENAAKQLNATTYNKGLPAAVVSLDGGGQAEAKRMENNWRMRFAGALKNFQLFFTSAKVDVKQLAHTNEQQQIIPIRKFERDTIIQNWGYPGELLGIIENANRSTIDTAQYRNEKLNVEPRRERMRRLLQDRVCPIYDARIFIDYWPEVPEDRAFQLAAMKGRPYAFTNNEARELAGLDATDEAWGDERPPTPVTAPTEPADTETIASGGSNIDAPPKSLELEEDPEEQPRRLLPRGKAPDPDDPDWDKSSIEDVLTAAEEAQIVDELSTALAAAVEDFGTAAIDDVAAGGESVFSMSNPAVTSYLDTVAGARVKGINATTLDDLRTYLQSAYSEGMSIDDMVDDLSDPSSGIFGEARAELVARTEILSGSNFGTLQGYKQSGVVNKKTWLATPGTKGSRPSHEDLDGLTIGIDEDFTDTETGAKGQAPGQFGDPGSDCNCRCAITAAIEDHEEDDGKSFSRLVRARTRALEQHAHHVARRAPHEAAMFKSASGALARQRSAVVKALKAARAA